MCLWPHSGTRKRRNGNEVENEGMSCELLAALSSNKNEIHRDKYFPLLYLKLAVCNCFISLQQPE